MKSFCPLCVLLVLMLCMSTVVAQEELTDFRALFAKARQVNEEDLPSLKKKGEEGDAGAAAVVGATYYRGVFGERDLEQAFDYMRRAAEAGEPNAQALVGLMYALGNGTPKNPSEGRSWWVKAIENGQLNASVLMGTAYENGEGVEPDLKEAVRWYDKAAKLGFYEGQRYLADMYANGKGVLLNFERAAFLYAKAARQGDAYSRDVLSRWRKSGYLRPFKDFRGKTHPISHARGTIRENEYESRYFGFFFVFPDGWEAANLEWMQHIDSLSKVQIIRRLFGGRPPPANVNMRPKVSRLLLVLSPHGFPDESAGFTANPLIRLWAEEPDVFVRNAEQYFGSTSLLTGGEREILYFPQSLEHAGKEFWRADVKSMVGDQWVYRSRWVLRARDHFVIFDVQADNAENLEAFLDAMDSLEFLELEPPRPRQELKPLPPLQ